MIEYIQGTKGISCVEIYMLALLKQRGIDESWLYTDSYLEIGNTLDDFLKSGARYASYAGKPRLQTIAKERGLLSLLTHHGDEKGQKFEYTLHEVRPGYKDGSAFVPWREDHYLLEFQKEYYDCYPPSRVETVNPKYFTGKRIGLCFNPIFETPAFSEKREKLVQSVPKVFQRIMFEVTEENLVSVRDALLYIKVFRDRMNTILMCPIVDKQINVITKLISLLEVFRLRKKIGAYAKLSEEINFLEESWKGKI